jgi:hypothetical protein
MDWIFTERGAEAAPFISRSVAFIDCQYTQCERVRAVVFWALRKKNQSQQHHTESEKRGGGEEK